MEKIKSRKKTSCRSEYKNSFFCIFLLLLFCIFFVFACMFLQIQGFQVIVTHQWKRREKKEERIEKREKRRKKREKRKKKREERKKKSRQKKEAIKCVAVARNLLVLIPFLPISRTCAGCCYTAPPLAWSLALTWRQGSSSRPLYGRWS